MNLIFKTMSKDLFFETRQQELADLVQAVEDGRDNALLAYAEIKQMKDLYAQAERQIEELAMDEAERYPEKSFSQHGYMFEKRNGTMRFSYKNIPAWQEIDQARKQCEEKHKQAFLSRQKGIMVATEDGEEIVLPEVSYNKNSLVVKREKHATH